MKPCTAVALLTVAASTAPVAAQSLLLFDTPQSATRAALTGGELMLRIDADDYRGLTSFVGGGTGLVGMRAVVQDDDSSTSSTFVLHVYTEGAVANLPAMTAGQPAGTGALVSMPVTIPGSGSGPVAYVLSVTFAAPIVLPGDRDAFLAVEFAGPAASELSVQTTTSSPGLLSFSYQPGPAMPANGSWLVAHDPAANRLAAYTVAGNGYQPMLEPILAGAIGLGVATTNQPGMPSPTSSFFTGLHPDTAQPPLHPGRHDGPGYAFVANGTAQPGDAVLLAATLGGFAAMPPIALPRGFVLIDPTQAVLLQSGQLDPQGIDLLFWPLPANARLRGLTVRSQGFALTANGVVSGSAVRQGL